VSLDRFVQKSVLRSALAMMRKPARLAGLSALQDFLARLRVVRADARRGGIPGDDPES
jgi:hypothetical protein